MADTILETVQNAADELVSKVVDAPKVEATKEEKVTETKEEKKDDELKLDPKRVESALQILDVLEDPEKSKAFIKALATQFEEKTADLSKKDQKTAAKELIDELREELGADEHLLGPTLKIFNKLLNERDAKIVDNFKELETKIARAQMERQYEDFMDRNEVTEVEQAKMNELAKDYPIGPDVPLNKYLARMHKLAKSELGITPKTKENTNPEKKAEVIENNAKKDAFNKGSVGTHKEAPVIKTPMDAVMAAMQQLQEK
jgi:hypothetical protein